MIESKMEELLIKQLTHGVSQWTYRPDLRTEEALWNNLREKLNRNNIDKLQGIPLTEGEYRRDLPCIYIRQWRGAGKRWSL